MKRIVKWSLVFILTFGQALVVSAREDKKGQEGQVVFEEGLVIKDLKAKEKKALYEKLDKILYSPETKEKAEELSNFEVIDSDKAYDKFIKESKKEAQIIYFGFQECPYCRAFSPKINQLAKEAQVTIYYYNVQDRQEDKNYIDIIETYGIDSVPHAFMVKDGKPDKIFLDSQSTMADMEAFINKVKD